MIRQGLSIFIGLLTLTAIARAAAPAAATEPTLDAQFAAARFAQILARSGSDKDLMLSLPLKNHDGAQLQQAFKEAGPFVKPQVSQPTAGTVLMSVDGHTIFVDFTGLGEGHVVVNKHVISMTAEKNFLNYRSEVIEALKASPKSVWLPLFSFAYADSGAHWYQRWGAAIADYIEMTPGTPSGVTVMDVPSEKRLAVDLVNATVADDNLFQDQANHYGPDANDAYSPLTFRCDGRTLVQVGHLKLDAHKNKVIVDGLTRTGPTAYSFKESVKGHLAQLDNTFNVVMPAAKLRKGQNLMTVMGNDFGRFPEIAQKCCVQTGCYDHYQAGIQPIMKHVGRSQQQQSHTSVQ